MEMQQDKLDEFHRENAHLGSWHNADRIVELIDPRQMSCDPKWIPADMPTTHTGAYLYVFIYKADFEERMSALKFMLSAQMTAVREKKEAKIAARGREWDRKHGR